MVSYGGPQWAPHMGSEDKANDVSRVLLPGCTPKFSQFIQDKRAVKSVMNGIDG